MSSIDTIALNCLVFEKIAFLHFGDRQTDKQMDSSDALSRSRYRERRLNNFKSHFNFNDVCDNSLLSELRIRKNQKHRV